MTDTPTTPLPKTPTNPTKDKTIPAHLVRKSAARLCAVQVLFQHEAEPERPIERIIQDLSLQLLHNQQDERDPEEGLEMEPDIALMSALANGAVGHKAELDAQISPLLSKQWSWQRIDPVLRAVLRVAAYELSQHPKTPTAVIIKEYMQVASAFVEDDEVGFINGVLDKLARIMR